MPVAVEAIVLQDSRSVHDEWKGSGFFWKEEPGADHVSKFWSCDLACPILANFVRGCSDRC